MLERIAGTVDAGSLAVPHGEHALDLARRVGFDLLRAEHGGGAEFFIDGRQELDVVRTQQPRGAPQFLVHRAQRRAAIAADKAAGIEAVGGVGGFLHAQQAHQRLGAGQEHAAAAAGEVVFQSVVGICKRGISQRGNQRCRRFKWSGLQICRLDRRRSGRPEGGIVTEFIVIVVVSIGGGRLPENPSKTGIDTRKDMTSNRKNYFYLCLDSR